MSYVRRSPYIYHVPNSSNFQSMSTPSIPQSHGIHVAWVDVLRIFACFLVVLAHCCDPFVGSYDKSVFDATCGAFWGSMVRPCVPLFAMISGVLLFPVTDDVSTFYKKRLKRILIPLVVWSLALPLMYYAYFSTGVVTQNPNIAMDSYTLSATLNKMYTFIFNFNYDTTPLWYLYMLVGLYLFMPVIGGWLKNASRKDVKLFLMVWGVSMCLPYVQMAAPFLGYTGNFGNMGILGICDWNPYGTFYYFAGFMGYMVLAHYLVKYPLDWSWAKTLGVACLMFLVGYAITFFGFLEMQKAFPGDYSKLEILWYFSGINVFMMTFAVFIVMQKIRVKPNPVLTKIAALTFGIYLCHFVLVQVAYDAVMSRIGTILPAYILIPLIAVCSFVISLVLVWILSLTRLTRKSIM